MKDEAVTGNPSRPPDRDSLIDAVCAPQPHGNRPDDLALLLVGRCSRLRALERTLLLHRYPTVDELRRCSHFDIETAIGRTLGRGLDFDALLPDVERDLRWLRKGADRFLRWIGERRYPDGLRRLYDPPAILYGWGDPATLDLPTVSDRRIAVVGTRQPDATGLKAAFNLGREAARWDIPVVSGLARGIDGAAHRGVVSQRGRAVVVFGSGIDTVYPREHRPLAADILRNGGVLLSEYPPGMPPAKFRFPGRNRIIVGLSDATVVVQAPEGSGALISADFAADIGEEVCVHTAGRDWRGTAGLMEGGARTVGSIAEVLSLIGAESEYEGGARDRVETSRSDAEFDHPALGAFGSPCGVEGRDDGRSAFRRIFHEGGVVHQCR